MLGRLLVPVSRVIWKPAVTALRVQTPLTYFSTGSLISSIIIIIRKAGYRFHQHSS